MHTYIHAHIGGVTIVMNELMNQQQQQQQQQQYSTKILGDGRMTRDYIYIDDVVNAITIAIRSEVCNVLYQVFIFEKFQNYGFLNFFSIFSKH